MGVPPLVSSILQCLRADYYALLLVHRGSFILACIFIPHLVIDSRPRWTSGNWPLDSIASWQSFPVCIVSTVVIGIKDKNTHANIFFIYVFLFSSNRTDRNIHSILWKSIRHSNKFSLSGVEVRLQALNDRMDLLERKNSALSGSPRSLWRRILLRLRGSSASTSTRN